MGSNNGFYSIGTFQSLETLDHHNQIHNDVKPQNYLIKFQNCENDLSHLKIVLTDFGLAGSDLKGGTPIFASPECMANPGRKDKSSDIFSLGRVYLFMLLPKAKFLEFLFVPLIKGGKKEIMKLIAEDPILNLILKMMRIKKRIDISNIRDDFNKIVQIRNWNIIAEISQIIQNSSSGYTNRYIDTLKHLS